MTPAAAAVFAIPFFLLPGLVFNLVAGVKGPHAMATALPVSFGICLLYTSDAADE